MRLKPKRSSITKVWYSSKGRSISALMSVKAASSASWLPQRHRARQQRVAQHRR
jgi:hypothetical protein